MFQDTADMSGIGNELDRSKKKTGGAGNYQSGITKIISAVWRNIVFHCFVFSLHTAKKSECKDNNCYDFL